MSLKWGVKTDETSYNIDKTFKHRAKFIINFLNLVIEIYSLECYESGEYPLLIEGDGQQLLKLLHAK